MNAATLESSQETTQRYAKCIEASKRIRWDIDRDVIRGRRFDFDKKFMPDGMSKIKQLTFLQPGEMRFMSQIQGRTYANIFGLVERYIGAKTLEISQGHWFGDQVALEALVRLTDEELKHQELFRRLEQMAAADMPAAIAADSPPLDPPGVRSRSHGFRVSPYRTLSVSYAIRNSGVFVLPSKIAPAFRSRRTDTASEFG